VNSNQITFIKQNVSSPVETIVKDKKVSKIVKHNEKILHYYHFIEEKASYYLYRSPFLMILMRLLFRK
jgi:hypothetical protein